MLGFSRLSLAFVMALPTVIPLILILANHSHRQRQNGFLLLKSFDGNSLDSQFPSQPLSAPLDLPPTFGPKSSCKSSIREAIKPTSVSHLPLCCGYLGPQLTHLGKYTIIFTQPGILIIDSGLNILQLIYSENWLGGDLTLGEEQSFLKGRLLEKFAVKNNNKYKQALCGYGEGMCPARRPLSSPKTGQIPWALCNTIFFLFPLRRKKLT